MDFLELKKVIDDQGRAWEEHKTTNDAILKAKADGKSVAELETKLAAIGAELDKLSEMKSQFDEALKQINRPFNETDAKSKNDLEVEVKQFNLALRSDLAFKNRPSEDFDTERYLAYKSGFFKLCAGVHMDNLDPNERKAMQAGSDPDGGYLLPNSTVGRIVGRLYEMSVARQLFFTQVLSGNKLEGVTDNDEADAGWVSELGTRSETDTPQVGRYEIEAYEMYAMPRATQRLLDDAAVDVEAWLAGKVANKFARVEGNGFYNGTGVGQARGLFTYTTAAASASGNAQTWGTFEHVVTGASGDFHTTKADPLQDLIGFMQPQYLANASWLMNRAVRTKIRKMKEATSDRYLWEPSLQAGQPDRLLGYAARTDEYVPAIAANSLSMAFGDFREAYTIVDRLGVRTLRDPYTTKGSVKFYTTKRTGGGAVNFDAVKFIKFGT